jgi:hypothetical protein
MSPRRHSPIYAAGVTWASSGLEPVDERPDGFVITKLGRQRLDAEHKAESANRSRSPLFRQ